MTADLDGKSGAKRAGPVGPAGHPWRFGFILAAIILLADQVTKVLMLEVLDIDGSGPIEVTPFLNFILVWNPGISYGLFPQEGALGRWGLVAFTVVASIAIAVWLARSSTRFTALALGLVLGGAIGNLIDRVRFGAVVDFVHFHVGTFSWYVFNVADAAIVFGVILLIGEAVLPSARRRSAPQETD